MQENNDIQIIRSSQELVKARQTEFRANVQQLVNNNMQRFQEILNSLDAKEFCDVLIKLIPYGYARMPEEKPKETPQQDVVVEKTILRQRLTED